MNKCLYVLCLRANFICGKQALQTEGDPAGFTQTDELVRSLCASLPFFSLSDLFREDGVIKLVRHGS